MLFIELHPLEDDEGPYLINVDQIDVVEASSRGTHAIISIRGWDSTLAVADTYEDIRSGLENRVHGVIRLHTSIKVPEVAAL